MLVDVSMSWEGEGRGEGPAWGGGRLAGPGVWISLGGRKGRMWWVEDRLSKRFLG